MSKRLPSILALALALALFGAACGGSNGDNDDESNENATETEETPEVETKSYSENDVSFDYPEEWDEFNADAAASSMGSNELWDATVGVDDTNLVNITAYQLNVEVTEDNLADIESELDGVIKQVVQQAGGTIASGPTATTLAGFPAYEYEWNDVDVDGDPKDSRAIFMFNGDVEYFLNCQYSADSEEDILAGCELILDTFEAAA